MKKRKPKGKKYFCPKCGHRAVLHLNNRYFCIRCNAYYYEGEVTSKKSPLTI